MLSQDSQPTHPFEKVAFCRPWTSGTKISETVLYSPTWFKPDQLLRSTYTDILFWWHPVLSNPLVSLLQFVFPKTKLDLNCEPEAPPLSTESWDSFLSRRSCPSTTRRTSGLARQHREEPSKFRGRCSRNENHRYTEKRVSNWDHFSVENL